jgi:hypothetical protein
MPTDPLLLVDTGADGVLLNLALAKLMGFHDSDLVTEECKGANGLMTVVATLRAPVFEEIACPEYRSDTDVAVFASTGAKFACLRGGPGVALARG